MYYAPRIMVKSGPFLTLSTCTGTSKRVKELEKTFHAICENMEGAAVAHICTLYGIPMVEIRGISNVVEDRDKKKWNIKLASKNCQKVVIEFLGNYNF
jgi:futalosine hydrolase